MNVDYLDIIDKDSMNQLTDKLKCPGGKVNVGGAMVTTTYFKFGAKSQMKLESSSNISRFYKTE